MKTWLLTLAALAVVFLAIAIFPLSVKAAPKAEPSVTGVTTVKVSGFEIVGNTAIQSSEIIAAINDYIKKNGWQNKPFYALEDIKTIAAVVTAHYRKKGFLLANVIVPEQDIKDGIVKLEVIEGSVGNVVIGGGGGSADFSKLKYYKKSYVEGWFENILGQSLNEAELERALLLANDTPGLTAKAVLEKGAETGKSDVQVKVEDVPYPVSLTLEYNNEGAKAVSSDRYGVYFAVTDPYFGSTLNVTGFMGDKLENTEYLGVDYSVPITGTGFRFGVRHIGADYIVSSGKYVDLGIEGDSDILGGYISHSCVRSRAVNLKLTAGYDRKHMFEYMLNTMVSNDDLAVAYLRADFDNIDRFAGKNLLSFTYSHGIPDFHGSLETSDVQASRLVSGGKFDKYNAELARLQKLWKFIFIARAAGQYSQDRLVNPELFAIGGSSTVRGFPVSSFVGDSGYAVTAELRVSLPFVSDNTMFGQKLGDMLQFAVFFDNGSVKRNTTVLVPGETKTDDISGAGYGVRINLFDRISVEADLAYPYMHGEFHERDEEITVRATLNVLKF